MDFLELIKHSWHVLVAVVTVVLAILTSGHAILFKRDSRAAVLWAGFIWLAPLVGAVLYWLLGFNRIRRKALNLRVDTDLAHLPNPYQTSVIEVESDSHLERRPHSLQLLANLIGRVTRRPLVRGNKVSPLVNGDEAFPAMLEAIDRATDHINLATYIFDHGKAGSKFVEALRRAVERGVEVRVLIDDTGARYSWPSIVPDLRKAGCKVVRFLPTLAPFRLMAINLRNHRKLLVVDGLIGFTGGMNIRDGHLIASKPKHPVYDLHFQLEGPVVRQLQEVFSEDWYFSRGERLSGPRFFPKQELHGEVIARGISDGPDGDFEKLRWTLLGALNCARDSIKIQTPYFLPDQALISALNLASLRGVQVDILLPSKNNLPFMQWATFAILWQVLEHGCRVWLTPPPFDHSKLMIVDEAWTLMGSANWDPRSLRLNFEFNVECFNIGLARQLLPRVQDKQEKSKEITLAMVDSRNVAVRLRDGIARLATPYL